MFDSASKSSDPTPVIGILISKASQAAGKTGKECAAALGIPLKRFNQMESGKVIPSLPEVEMLAFFFDLPPQELLAKEIRDFPNTRVSVEQMQQLVQLRQRIISATLQLSRSDRKISLKDLSAQSGIPAAKIKRYELTAQPVPLNDLEAICKSLEIPVESLLDQTSFITEKQKKIEAEFTFQSLPPEMRKFVTEPDNLSFLKLAMRLKETGIENIKNLALGLQQMADRVKE
jgi:transcriptional regulator with XRE-family HTH domain